MRIGEQSPIGDDDRFDAGAERLTLFEALLLAREQFEHDE